MKKKKTLVIVIILFIGSFHAYSQLGVTAYSTEALGLNTGHNKSISGELKVFTNRDIENVRLEVDLFYNFKPGKYHRLAIGLGLNSMLFRENYFSHQFSEGKFNRYTGLTIPAFIEIYPLQDFKKFSLLFELAPHFQGEYGTFLRSLWGIRYTFGNK